MAATTGLRRGEVCALRWREDVDLDAGALSVAQAVSNVGGQLVFAPPKTAKGRRRVALDAGTVAVLREHRRRQLTERLAAGPLWQDSGLLFTNTIGSPVDPTTLSETFAGLSHAVGLPRIRLHDLRHSYATLALQAGVHPKVVSERLGHSSVAFTLDCYSHSVPAMQTDAAERIAAVIFGS